ncbi:kynureninase-like [Physella acuta]|uniref:kynureninase-like n=1 Tax=Physella acuta TaxID=109671 RepID=UPI0027DE24E3|nr:kynureninase-like [Physella acuta]XP_059169088.1 kynureninase-like [Physella acuta]XP_059169090.1 kynureninase-like [Physella acuta]XP_059169091.1 kynureninase-like [Physella acuta]
MSCESVQNGLIQNHPLNELKQIAEDNDLDILDLKFAKLMDEKDPLRHLRDEFHYPKMGDILNTDPKIVDPSEDCVYFCGNSLGLCPKKTKEYMNIEVDKWASLGVQGHTNGDLPWAWCDELLEEDMAKIVGCNREEVALMNGLTVNLHLLLISFYRPTKDRYKILCESKAFPSDHYAFESQSMLHGYNPNDVMICVEPRQGEFTLRTEDILEVIEKEGDKIAVVCFAGVQYYTGQLFDIQTITKAGHAKGCYVGWDMAHAVGNVPLYLHDWDIDFACWCTYKYLNASAGGLAGLFIHEKFRSNNFPKLLGWWGHDMSTRFKMDNKMELIPGARGYRISNTPGFLCAPLKASFEVFKKTSVEDLRKKSLLLTSYLEFLVLHYYRRPAGDTPDGDNIYIDIFTPADPQQRGAQLSLAFNVCIEQLFKELERRGVVCDKRLPRVIRITPVPMYCSFEDVHRFMALLKDALLAAKGSLSHVDQTTV